MSNGRKPVPYPTSLWTEPPGGFITRRPCQRVGFAQEISTKKSNGPRRTAGNLRVSFARKMENRFRKHTLRECGCCVAFLHGGLKRNPVGINCRKRCCEAFLHGGLKHRHVFPKSSRRCCEAFLHGGLKRGIMPRYEIIRCCEAFLHGGLKPCRCRSRRA